MNLKEYHQDIANLEDTVTVGKAHKGTDFAAESDHQLLVLQTELLRLLNTKNTMVTMLNQAQ